MDRLVLEQLGLVPDELFVAFDPAPRAISRWTQRHDARLPSGERVAVTIVRPDAERLLGRDLPLLPLLGPWLDTPADALASAIDDFATTLRLRLDQTQQCLAFTRLADDARDGGALDAPSCFPHYCGPGVLTTAWMDARPITDAVDPVAAARHLSTAWIRQALTGRVVPFDFTLDDVWMRDGRVVLAGGTLESQTADERARLLTYFAAAAADDPDAAWDWIAKAATPGSAAESEYRLRCRLRQAVPFRDGESSEDDRLAERILVHWRATRDARWTVRSRPLHVYRGLQVVSAIAASLAPEEDALLEALRMERLRVGVDGVRRLFDPRRLPLAIEASVGDMLQLPQKLDEFLSLAAEGRLRVKLHASDGGESRRARNRTVLLMTGLVALVGVAVLARHVVPAYGDAAERVAAALLMVIGGWLLVAASRL